MTKSNITEYDKVAANNTDVQDVPLGENQMYPSDVNNAFREIMADLAAVNDGTVSLTSPKATAFEVTNNITVGGTVDGRDVATDGTKLDGIEASADVTDTANVTAAGALMDSEVTNLAQVKAFDSSDYATAAQGALADSALQSETVTSIALNTNSLDYTDENGSVTSIDLSVYLDEDARAIASGTLNSVTGIVTFTRDDATTFTLDLSDLLDDTNLVTSVAGKTGVVTLDADDIDDASTTNKFTTAAEITKLAGIETGATADQSASEIKTAYESNANTNEFSDAEQSKLAGIETGATADQTAAEIRALVESATDSNVFTDADHSKLNGIEAGAEVNTVDSVNTQTGAVVLDAADVGALALTGGTLTGNLSFSDGDKAIFGAGNDLQIYHDGSNSYIDEAGSGGLYIRANSFLTLQKYTGENLAQLLSDGEVRLFYDGGQKLATKATGIDVTGTVTADGGAFTGDVTFGDNNKAIFGAGSDLQIYHDGSNSVVKDAGTGSLELQGSSWVILKGATSGNWGVAHLDGGQTNLYHNGSLKLATTSTGVSVTGEIVASGNVTAYSDERLKDNIETLDGSKVYEMRGVSYTKDGEASSGVIAQELQKVAPELVNDSGEYLSVAYGNLVGYLIEAVKELKAEVEALKSEK